jgi:hypothetical protein
VQVLSRLGWVGSMTGLLLFFCLTLWISSMLADVYQVILLAVMTIITCTMLVCGH